MVQRRRTTADREIEAISAILQALDGLDGETIRRVLDYVFSRLSIAVPSHIKTASAAPPIQAIPSGEASHRLSRVSIRDLREEKQPESSNQMAALVAYYLSEVVGDSERRESVNTADLEKYFKQAGFRLPKSPSQTLPNAAAAGYFDAVGNGLYKINPVGYNLVVHGLPRGHSPGEKKAARRPKKTTPKRKRRS